MHLDRGVRRAGWRAAALCTHSAATHGINVLNKWQLNLLTALGTVALLLAVANALLFMQNRGQQAELAQQQQFIQQTVPLEGLYREIIKALAEMALKGNDRQVLDMLASQGINVTPNSTTPGVDAAGAKGQK